jgi:hypothetical protein
LFLIVQFIGSLYNYPVKDGTKRVRYPLAANCPRWNLGNSPLQCLMEASDLVQLSWVQALLKDSGIESFVFDSNMGQIGLNLMVRPRVMVADEDLAAARQVLDEAKIDDDKT